MTERGTATILETASAGTPGKPKITMVTTPDSTTVRVYFDQEMFHTDPEGDNDTLNVDNYVLETLGTGVTIVPDSVALQQGAPTVVNITLNREMTKNCLYKVTANNVKGQFGGQTIDPNYKFLTFNGFGYSPELDSAIAIDGVVVRVIFTEAMLIDSALSNPANYTFTPGGGASPVAAESVQIRGVDRVEVWLASALTVGGDYTVSVWNVKDLAGNPIADPPGNTAEFTGVAQQSKVDRVETVHERKLRIWFNKPMLKDTELVNPANYVFTPPPGAAPLYFSQIRTPNELYPYYVDIETSEMTNLAVYTATISTNLHDRWGNHISPDFNEVVFDGLGVQPTVVSVKPISASLADVYFSENMRDNADIRDIASYHFDNGLSVLSVVEVDGSRVRLQTGEQVAGQLYNLIVYP